MIAEFVGTKS
jgi:hypothetical protein